MATQYTDRAEFPDIFADDPAPAPSPAAPAYFEIALNRAELETMLQGMSFAAQAMQDTADEIAETAGEEHAATFRERQTAYKSIADQAGRILARHRPARDRAATPSQPRPAIDHDARPPAAAAPNYGLWLARLDQVTQKAILWLVVIFLLWLAIVPLSPPPIQP